MRGRGGAWRRRGNIVATLLVVIVLLASFYVVQRTYFSAEKVPLLGTSKAGAIGDIQDLLEKAVRKWLSQGMVDHDLACNGVYSFTDDDLLQELRVIIADNLVGYSVPGGALTIGQLGNVSFRGPNALEVSLGNTTFVYNESSIYAESEFRNRYVVMTRAKLFRDVVDQWLTCDAGNLSGALSDAFGDCFWGKLSTKCQANGEAMPAIIGPDDWNIVYRSNATQEQVALGVERAVATLNSYFAGEASCGQPLITKPSGITCSFTLTDISVDNKYVDFGSTMRPPIGLNDDLRSIPLTPIKTALNDTVLGCDRSPERIATPNVTSVELSRQYLEDHYKSKYNIGKPPVGRFAAVASQRTAKFTVKARCTDPQSALLGMPVEYTFTFRYGLKAVCDMPQKMIPTGGACGGACGYHPNCPACQTLSPHGDTSALCEQMLQKIKEENPDADIVALRNDMCGANAAITVCCGGAGLAEGAYGKEAWNSACCGPLDCDSVQGDCFKYKCDPSLAPDQSGWGGKEEAQAQCVRTGEVKVGDKRVCPTCKACNAAGECDADPSQADVVCQTPPNWCYVKTCGADASCSVQKNLPDGTWCGSNYNECTSGTCQSGDCKPPTGRSCSETHECQTCKGTCQGWTCDAPSCTSIPGCGNPPPPHNGSCCGPDGNICPCPP